MADLRIDLRGVVYPDDGWWVAHCLEFDIAAEGKNPPQAIASLISLCDFQIRTAMKEGNLDSIYRSAPPEIWNLYSKAQDSTRPRPRLPRGVTRFDVRELAHA